MGNGSLEGPALLLLNSNGVERHWEEIKRVAEMSTPPDEEFTDEGALILLDNLQQEKAQAWVLTEDGRIKGMALTQVRVEVAFGTANLIVLGVLSQEGIGMPLWKKGLVTLRRFAHSKGCSYITGFTLSPGIVEVAKRLGGDTDFSFVRFKVEESEVT